MERIASADCLDRAAFWNVIDFADLHSRDVTVLGEARWNEPEVSPPIRPRGWQRRCRIGAISFVKVMSPGDAPDCPRMAAGVKKPAKTGTSHTRRSAEARNPNGPPTFIHIPP